MFKLAVRGRSSMALFTFFNSWVTPDDACPDLARKLVHAARLVMVVILCARHC